MATIFENIDFGFRRGSKEALDTTAIANGTWNIAVDKCELYVDVDNVRLPLTSVLVFDKEEEIYAIASPVRKFYYAIDTSNFLFFNTADLKWKIIGEENVKYARRAGSDEDGHVFSEYYESKEDATTAFNSVNSALSELRTSIAQIASFDIIILQPDEELPDEGVEHTIYFVPKDVGDAESQYEEYLWLVEGQYFERIGSTSASMGDYYTKTETDDMIAAVQSTVDSHITEADERLNTFESQISGYNTAISSNTSNISTLNGNVVDNYADHETKFGRIATFTESDTTIDFGDEG